ncbi:MAG: hypothetical protein QM741_13685 [Rudaea sp.]|uniref:hypothetical protein n=1 Tax=Rudaea sp. TaxID=2136325 RepID=UPI0039E36430
MIAADHMRRVYGTHAPCAPDLEVLRRQLADLPDHVAGMIWEAASRPSPDKLELLASRLNGVARLALTLAAALITESKATEGAADGS